MSLKLNTYKHVSAVPAGPAALQSSNNINATDYRGNEKVSAVITHTTHDMLSAVLLYMYCSPRDALIVSTCSASSLTIASKTSFKLTSVSP